MDKRTEFNNILKEAMKARDEITTATMRLIIAALKDRDINARGTGKAEGITDAEIMSMLQGMIKQRQESADTYAKANRPELAERENKEIEVIKRFLPTQLSDDEVRKAIDGLIEDMNIRDMREMGKLMAELKSRFSGQMDMSKASGLIKERLASLGAYLLDIEHVHTPTFYERAARPAYPVRNCRPEGAADPCGAGVQGLLPVS